MIMAMTFDGTLVPAKLPRMPCGGVPVFDDKSGYAYRCNECMAVIGSVGQSDYCKALNKDLSEEFHGKNTSIND